MLPAADGQALLSAPAAVLMGTLGFELASAWGESAPLAALGALSAGFGAEEGPWGPGTSSQPSRPPLPTPPPLLKSAVRQGWVAVIGETPQGAPSPQASLWGGVGRLGWTRPSWAWLPAHPVAHRESHREIFLLKTWSGEG